MRCSHNSNPEGKFFQCLTHVLTHLYSSWSTDKHQRFSLGTIYSISCQNAFISGPVHEQFSLLVSLLHELTEVNDHMRVVIHMKIGKRQQEISYVIFISKAILNTQRKKMNLIKTHRRTLPQDKITLQFIKSCQFFIKV